MFEEPGEVFADAVAEVLRSQHEALENFLASWRSRQEEVMRSLVLEFVAGRDSMSLSDDVTCGSPRYSANTGLPSRKTARVDDGEPVTKDEADELKLQAHRTSKETLAVKSNKRKLTFGQTYSSVFAARGALPKEASRTRKENHADKFVSQWTRSKQGSNHSSEHGVSSFDSAREMDLAHAYFLEQRFKDPLMVRRAAAFTRFDFGTGTMFRRTRRKFDTWKHRARKELQDTYLARLVTSTHFEIICVAMIVLNTGAMTVSIDMDARHSSTERSTTVFNWVDFIFCCLFSFELLLRVVGLRAHFFFGEDAVVNVADFALIPLYLVMATTELMQGYSEQTTRMSYIRILRFLRFLKLGRCTRALRMIPWVRIISGSILFCGRFAFPTLVLVVSLPYVFSLVILNILANSKEEELAQLRGWSSVADAMISLLSTALGGADWSVVGDHLLDFGILPYLLFLLHAIVFRLMMVNVIMSGYFQNTLKQMHLNTRQKMHLQLEVADEHVASLQEVFLGDSITYDDFVQAVKDRRVVKVLKVLTVQPSDADRLVFHLTAGGTKQVALSTFVRGAIMLNDAASKMDTLETQVNVELAKKKINLSGRRHYLGRSSVLHSLHEKIPLHVIPLAPHVVPKQLQELVKVMPFHREDDRATFTKTVLDIWAVLRSVSGGCGFIIAPQSGFLSAADRDVDFQVVDRTDKFPNGYMTERLRDVPADSAAFLEAMMEFTLHSDNDRWPKGHEASDMPKDGFTLIDGNSGLRLKCAARMVGLPLPPYQWDNVGTRHLAALAACWAFRFSPSIVMVRSDSGKIHVLHAFDESHGLVALTATQDGPDLSCGMSHSGFPRKDPMQQFVAV